MMALDTDRVDVLLHLHEAAAALGRAPLAGLERMAAVFGLQIFEEGRAHPVRFTLELEDLFVPARKIIRWWQAGVIGHGRIPNLRRITTASSMVSATAK